MISNVAAKRYAKGLLQLAIEQNQVEAQLKDMQFIRSTFEGSPQLQRVLVSPVIKDTKKKDIIDQLFTASVGTTTKRLIEIMSEKGRLNLLLGAAVNFEKLYNVYAGILEVTITSAYELDKNQIDGIVEQFSNVIGLKIRPTVRIDKQLLGGLTLKYNDTVIDGSVRNKLEQLTQSLQAKTV